MPPQTGGCRTLKVTTWNVRSAQGAALHAIGRALESLEVNFAFLQEMKIMKGKYPRKLQHGGYNVISTNGFSSSRGGVALVWRKRDHFVVEEQKKIHNNVMTARIIAGENKYYVVGCYCPPPLEDREEAWEHVKKVWKQCPRGFSPLLMGDLNLDIDRPNNQTERDIVTNINEMFLEPVDEHFFRRRGKGIFGIWTHRQKVEGRWHSRRIDYILLRKEDKRKVSRMRRVLPRHH